MIDKLLSDYRQTLQAIKAEKQLREGIIYGDRYQKLQTELEGIQEEQLKMLHEIPDTSEEHDLDKKALFDHMSENSIDTLEGCEVKTRVKREVDVLGVLHALEGDIDSLMIVVSVKQKDLQTFSKANTTYKKALKACVKDVGFSIIDIIPTE